MGFKIDFDDLLNSGYYFNSGTAGGASLGIAVGGGYARRDIEGKSVNFDANIGKYSGNVGFDDKGLNSVAVTVGPGGGASSSYTNTKTLSPRSIMNMFK